MTLSRTLKRLQSVQRSRKDRRMTHSTSNKIYRCLFEFRVQVGWSRLGRGRTHAHWSFDAMSSAVLHSPSEPSSSSPASSTSNPPLCTELCIAPLLSTGGTSALGAGLEAGTFGTGAADAGVGLPGARVGSGLDAGDFGSDGRCRACRRVDFC